MSNFRLLSPEIEKNKMLLKLEIQKLTIMLNIRKRLCLAVIKLVILDEKQSYTGVEMEDCVECGGEYVGFRFII